eukprot:1822656-Amphidinium_carterae.1
MFFGDHGVVVSGAPHADIVAELETSGIQGRFPSVITSAAQTVDVWVGEQRTAPKACVHIEKHLCSGVVSVDPKGMRIVKSIRCISAKCVLSIHSRTDAVAIAAMTEIQPALATGAEATEQEKLQHIVQEALASSDSHKMAEHAPTVAPFLCHEESVTRDAAVSFFELC